VLISIVEDRNIFDHIFKLCTRNLYRIGGKLTLSRRLVSIHDTVVPATAPDAQPFTVLDHDEENRRRSHADQGCGNKAVLIAQVRQPRGDAKPH
jgi:hypothetical protein